MVRIPAGATNIEIKQVSYSGLPEDDNYLGELVQKTRPDYPGNTTALWYMLYIQNDCRVYMSWYLRDTQMKNPMLLQWHMSRTAVVLRWCFTVTPPGIWGHRESKRRMIDRRRGANESERACPGSLSSCSHSSQKAKQTHTADEWDMTWFHLTTKSSPR